MINKQYVETYNKSMEKLRTAEEFYSDEDLENALKNYQSAANLLTQAIKQADEVRDLDAVVELQNLLVFISIEVDSIEQDIENQM